METLSICIPTKDRPDSLDRALYSLTQQTNSPLDGDNVKHWDYLSSIAAPEITEPICFRKGVSIGTLEQAALNFPKDIPRPLITGLWECCPFVELNFDLIN